MEKKKVVVGMSGSGRMKKKPRWKNMAAVVV